MGEAGRENQTKKSGGKGRGRWGTPHPYDSPSPGPEGLMHGWLTLLGRKPELYPHVNHPPRGARPHCHDNGLGAQAFPGDKEVTGSREGQPEPP